MVLKKNNLFIHILKNGHHDHFGVIEVKQYLNMKSGGDMKSNLDSIGALNILKSAKDSLNATMSFLDKQ